MRQIAGQLVGWAPPGYYHTIQSTVSKLNHVLSTSKISMLKILSPHPNPSILILNWPTPYFQTLFRACGIFTILWSESNLFHMFHFYYCEWNFQFHQCELNNMWYTSDVTNYGLFFTCIRNVNWEINANIMLKSG